ncbi:MAG: redox-regulated ATPase YchF [Puniceicoccales bacterium]|jgi:GTP-binding protein YchF|nr:redox-regulated ATPase YchF [Puniceicoccales bacterium]
MLKVGIIGLPNVGKSTLFNALTRTHKATAENYPFCTIEPNIGMVEVPDERLLPLTQIAKTDKIVPALIEFVDIAGLVAGASHGEGLGNQFLSHIREVDAIVQVVRCFENEDIIHTMGSVDPIRDIEVIQTELALADLQSAEGQLEKLRKKARSREKEAEEQVVLLEIICAHLNQEKTVFTLPLSLEERGRMRGFHLLTAKPVLFVCNVAEEDLKDPSQNPHVLEVGRYVQEHLAMESCIVSAQIEHELIALLPEEAKVYLAEMGIEDSGVTQLIRKSYELLKLASYFTAGEKEVHAWTFRRGMKAPACAGVIHGDFEHGFIKAEVVSYEDLIAAGSVARARELGLYRLEGKDYEVQDGDVMVFRFNV